MPPVLSRLRRQLPYLTPPFAGEDDDALAGLLRRRPTMDYRVDIDDVGVPSPLDLEPIRPQLTGWGNVPLPRTDPNDIDRIAALGEPAPPPILERRETPLMANPIDVPPLPRQRPEVIYSNGRPTPVVFGTDDPEQRLLTQRQALEQYQPQKESKKHLALRTVLGFLGGGLAGRGGVAETLLGQGGIMDRRGIDRAWQQDELARSDETLGRMRLDRRAGLQDRLLESQVRENEAEALDKGRVPAIKDLEVGGRLLRPNAQGGYDEVYAPPVKPESQRPITSTSTENGVTYQTEYDAQSGRWRKSVGADGQPVVIREVKPDANNNEQIEQVLAEIEADKRKVADAIANTAEFLPDTDQWGVKVGERPNPIHQSLKARERALDDKRRDLMLKRKPTARPSGKYAGRPMSRAKLPDAAKRLKMSEAEAEAYIKREGGVIY